MGRKRSPPHLLHPDLRAKAEAELARGPPGDIQTRSVEELLHELQVHQIELEMQNEALRQSQVAIEESRDLYVDLYEFAPVGYLTLTDAGLINEINLVGAGLLGEDRKKLLRRQFASFVVPEDRDEWHRCFLHVLRHGGKQTCEPRLTRGDGAIFDAALDCLRTVVGDATPMLRVALTDISVRKRSEERMRVTQHAEHLRQLAVEATLAEERERRAIATDLHDDLGQTLHVVRLKLDTLAKRLAEGTAVDGLLQDVRDLLTDGSRMVRSLISQLSPPPFIDLDLPSALSWLAGEMERTYGLTVTVEDDGVPKPLSSALSAILFRVVRELLINVSKHARCGSAVIRVRAGGGRLRLTVEDKGIGMTDWRAAMSRRNGFGLAIVQERIAYFEGTMDVLTRPGDGTVVILEIPFDPGLP